MKLFQVVIISVIALTQPLGAPSGLLPAPGKISFPPSSFSLWDFFFLIFLFFWPFSEAPQVAAGCEGKRVGQHRGAPVGVSPLAGLAGRQALLACAGNGRSPALGSGRNFPPAQIGSSAWGFFAFLCSTEHGLFPRLLWPFQVSACLLLQHQDTSCALQLAVSLPWGTFVAGAPALPFLPYPWRVLACTKQRVLGKAAGLRLHQELPLVSCPCVHAIKVKGCSPLLGVLFVSCACWLWPESLVLQLRCQEVPVPSWPGGLSCSLGSLEN